MHNVVVTIKRTLNLDFYQSTASPPKHIKILFIAKSLYSVTLKHNSCPYSFLLRKQRKKWSNFYPKLHLNSKQFFFIWSSIFHQVYVLIVCLSDISQHCQWWVHTHICVPLGNNTKGQNSSTSSPFRCSLTTIMEPSLKDPDRLSSYPYINVNTHRRLCCGRLYKGIKFPNERLILPSIPSKERFPKHNTCFSNCISRGFAIVILHLDSARGMMDLLLRILVSISNTFTRFSNG